MPSHVLPEHCSSRITPSLARVRWEHPTAELESSRRASQEGFQQRAFFCPGVTGREPGISLSQ